MGGKTSCNEEHRNTGEDFKERKELGAVHTPVIPARQEADAGGPLEPRTLRPDWAREQDPISNEEMSYA